MEDTHPKPTKTMSNTEIVKARMLRDEIERKRDWIKRYSERLEEERGALRKLEDDLALVGVPDTRSLSPAEELTLRLTKAGAKRVLIMLTDDTKTAVIIYIDHNHPMSCTLPIPRMKDDPAWWTCFMRELKPNRSWKTMWKDATLASRKNPSRVLVELP
jgi:hypothetical protein